MININIRTLQSGDVAIIDFINKRLSSRWGLTEKEVEAKYVSPSFLGGFPYIFIALTEKGDFIGNVFLCLEVRGFLNICNQPWLTALFVEEEFRCQGIAQELIKAVEVKCRSLGLKNLYLDTVQAVGYYRKLGGWEEIGTDLWHEQATTVMVKRV